MKTIDRYLIREILPPFLLALGLFTFLLAVNPMLEYAQQFLAKGVALPTVAFLLVTVLPQALGDAAPCPHGIPGRCCKPVRLNAACRESEDGPAQGCAGAATRQRRCGSARKPRFSGAT